jgi:hypothetical protein
LFSTVEVFQSFGFAHRLIEEGAHINEVVHWEPAPEGAEGSAARGAGGIVRKERLPDNEPGTSRHPHAVLTQGRIERFMLDAMKEFSECNESAGLSSQAGWRWSSSRRELTPGALPQTGSKSNARFSLLH